MEGADRPPLPSRRCVPGDLERHGMPAVRTGVPGRRDQVDNAGDTTGDVVVLEWVPVGISAEAEADPPANEAFTTRASHLSEELRAGQSDQRPGQPQQHA